MLEKILFDSSLLQVSEVEVEESQLVLSASTTQHEAICPDCSMPSTRIHSSYRRHPADLPFADYESRLLLKVRRFFCQNPDCSKTTFTERLPQFLPPYARRTNRVSQKQRQVASFLSAEAASRLLALLKMPTSPDTLLRAIRQIPVVPKPKPRVIGVDDWAFRKGHTYGTILVDLETHEVIELLDERSADSFAAWLTQNPGIEVISRDRGGEFIAGATSAAPDAIQVADRWHLMKNLREALQRFFEWKKSLLRKAAELDHEHQEQNNKQEESEKSEPSPKPEEQKATSNERKKELFDTVKELQQAGMSLRGIARELKISRITVKKYVGLENSPTYPIVKRKAYKLGPYQEKLQQLWEQGCHKGTELYENIKESGYTGALMTVQRWTARQRNSVHPPATQTPHPKKVIPWSPQRASWLFFKEESKLKENESQLLKELLQNDSVAAKVHQLGQEFQQMVRERSPGKLEGWLTSVQESGIAALTSFAKGLKQDIAAVIAGLSLPWSNGQTEGQVNRLKFIKRQMYGRANFDLLRMKVLTRT